MSRSEPTVITEDDGPFSYRYVAVLAVPGIRLEETDSDIHLFSFPELNATASLTRDSNWHCLHIDRNSAIALLLLTGFRGRRRFKRLSSWTNGIFRRIFGTSKIFEWNLRREERKAKSARLKEHKSPGCYVVYQAEGDLGAPPRLKLSRRVNRIGFGFNIIDVEHYRSIHRSALHGVVAALSLTIDKGTGSPEITNIADIVYLKVSDDLSIYPKRVEGKAAAVVTSKVPSTDELKEVARNIPQITGDRRLQGAISLFVESHRKDGDNLRSFIPAWSALEILVNRVARLIRGEWERVLLAGELPEWDKDLTGVEWGSYRMRDRFYAVACTLNPDDAAADCETFIQSNDRRSDYYHRNDVREDDLPTHNVRALFRKYLELWLTNARSINNAT